jgi:hypothetical protein
LLPHASGYKVMTKNAIHRTAPTTRLNQYKVKNYNRRFTSVIDSSSKVNRATENVSECGYRTWSGASQRNVRLFIAFSKHTRTTVWSRCSHKFYHRSTFEPSRTVVGKLFLLGLGRMNFEVTEEMRAKQENFCTTEMFKQLSIISYDWTLRPNIYMHLSFPSVTRICPTYLILLDFINLVIFCEECILWSSSLCNFLEPPPLPRLCPSAPSSQTLLS